MSFWNQPTVEPKRKHRFKIIASGVEDEVWWWAKSVNLPAYEVNLGEYQLGNHKFKFPGILGWNEITITMVDPQKKAVALVSKLKKTGWNIPKNGGDVGINKHSYNLGMSIILLDAEGKEREKYELKGAFIKSMSMGDLSYDSDELVETQMVIAYDYPIINGDDGGAGAVPKTEAPAQQAQANAQAVAQQVERLEHTDEEYWSDIDLEPDFDPSEAPLVDTPPAPNAPQ